MPKLEGTQTLLNLMKAFAGESQARNRYTFYASVALKAGFNQIAAIFLETADNEKEHAKLYYKHIVDGMDAAAAIPVEITATYPVGLGDTHQNLLSAAAGEHEEWTELYNVFADVAQAEGFKDIATTFRMIREVEKRHEARYLKLADNVAKGEVFYKTTEVAWKCLNCGYIYEGSSVPDICPTCKHPRAYFELFCPNY
jgi:rubrerythrin